MQKARRHPDKSGLRPLVSVWFQVLFTPLIGVLFTFPLRYQFTIGLSVVFSLTGWCRQIQTEFHLLRPTQDTRLYINLPSTGLSPPSVALSIAFLFNIYTFCRSYNPILYLIWFRLFRFRSPLLTESLLFSLPPVTQMFQFTGLPPCFHMALCLQHNRLPHSDIRGSMFVCNSPQLFAAYHVLRSL